jgi:glycosyltransferase involved in cell wall biosynthesis
LIEAMSFGKPLVASNIKGNRECVWPRENGFLCPPRHVESFRDAIITLSTDKAKYAAMSQCSRALAVRYFDAAKNASAVIDLYERALASPGRATGSIQPEYPAN